MIGNDVVDLNLAKIQSNWQRKGFLNKIFTKKEQQFIKNAKDSFITVWLLWSMKESVYKIYSRQNNVRFFAPKKFECNINKLLQTVKIDHVLYYTKSKITKDSIHTIAQLNPTKLVRKDCFELENGSYNIQHSTTHKYLKSAIAVQFNIPLTQVKIEKDNNGIPNIKDLGIISSLSTKPVLSVVERLKTGSFEKSTISISHHGVFGAYAFVV